MSVSEAAKRKFKVNHRGQAVEARSQDVACHVLINYFDVVAMAIVLGMLPPAGYESETCNVSAADTTKALRLVMDKVREGVRVALIPKKRRGARLSAAFYLHNRGASGGYQLRARFVPEAIMLTSRVGTKPGNDWLSSIFKKKGMSVRDAFPVALVGKGGWETPKRGRPWPRVSSEVYAGHSGVSQVARLSVVFEKYC
jgi:hypothetical protein